MSLDGDGDEHVAPSYANLIVAASLTKQVAQPLLDQLHSQLYRLDIDFDRDLHVSHDELEQSLQISIDELYSGFYSSTGRVSRHLGTTAAQISPHHYSSREAARTRNAGDSTSGIGALLGETIVDPQTVSFSCTAESSVEFMLSALAWARSRIALLHGPHGTEKSHPAHPSLACSSSAAATAIAGKQSSSGLIDPFSASSKFFSPTDDAPTAQLHHSKATRRRIVAAFRSIHGRLVLPYSEAEEAHLEAIIGSISTTLRRPAAVCAQYCAGMAQ